MDWSLEHAPERHFRVEDSFRYVPYSVSSLHAQPTPHISHRTSQRTSGQPPLRSSAVRLQIDGFARLVELHERPRVRHLPPEEQRGDAPRLVRAARRAPDAAHVLDAVPREVEEHHVPHLPVSARAKVRSEVPEGGRGLRAAREGGVLAPAGSPCRARRGRCR